MLPPLIIEAIAKAVRWIRGRISSAISGLSKRASGMPVPSSMNDLSATESANSPAGSDAISTSLDNYMRAIQAIVRSTNHKGPDIASAASVAIGAAIGEFLTVTGTTGITSFDSVTAGIVRVVQFSGVLTITHSTNIQLPGSANYTTASGDVLTFRSLGSGQWVCVGLTREQNNNRVYYAYKPTDTTRTLQTTVSADPHLVITGLTNSGVYAVEGNLSFFYSGATPGAQFTINNNGTIPQAMSCVVTCLGNSAASTPKGAAVLGVNTPTLMSSTSTGGTPGAAISGFIKLASGGDTIQISWAQEASSASGTMLNKGSWLRVTYLGT